MLTRLRQDEQGALSPLFLVVMVALAGGTLLFMQVGNASVLAAEAETAADAAALAGAENLGEQLYGLDGLESVDTGAACAAAGDYAQRNDATLTDCDVSLTDLTVTVEVRGSTGIIGGPLQDVQDERPVRSARAEVGLPVAGGAGPGGPGSGSSSLTHADLRADLQDASVPELIGVMAQEAQRVHELRLPYVWGGGHCCSPTPANGPFDCSGAVSHALQTIFPDFPTMVSGQFVNVGKPGPSPSGRGVTIYAYDGHVFMVIGGQGWGTGENGWSDGAGWLPYNTPYHGKFRARHIPLLEPGPGQVADVEDLMKGVGLGGPGGPGGPPVTANVSIRLIPLDGDPDNGGGNPAPSDGLVLPVDGPITSHYGMRTHPITGEHKLHDGTDFGVACGTPVRAAASGTITDQYHNAGYGNRVIIDHGTISGQRVATTYNHLSGYALGPGTTVEQGQVIGYVGSTGYSTGCHLHWMVLANGSTTDPMNWVG